MAGNGRPNAQDIAPKIRKAFIRAVKRNGGAEYLDRLMTESLDKDFIGTLNALSKFNPKTTNVNRSNTLQINVDASVKGWIEGFQAGQQVLEHQDAETIPIHAPVTLSEPAQATNASDPTLPYTFDLEEEEEAVAVPSKAPDYPPIAQADPDALAKMRSR